jgi:hypothetical protein
MKLFQNLWAKEAPANTVPRPACSCLNPQYGKGKWRELQIHREEQDTQCSAWYRLNELIEQAAGDGRETFSPGPEMRPEEWAQITRLPKSIAKLRAVKHLNLYGSSLVSLPPEIGELTALREFTPYTSYRLHWFPFEITRCRKLKDSTVSTRALFGNYKYRAPFPMLPQMHPSLVPDKCSVCQGAFGSAQPLQCWISLTVATDVLPLLVHACSQECLSSLPKPPDKYVAAPHQGGLSLKQPKREW